MQWHHSDVGDAHNKENIMDKKFIALMGTGPLGLWTAAALASDPQQSGELHIRMGNRRGKAPAWLPDSVQKAFKEGRLSWHAIDAINAESVRRFAEGASALIHSAIPDYHEWVEKLPVIQKNAIDAALATKARLICADNLYAYAPPVSGPIDEDTPQIPPAQKGQLRKDMLAMMRKAQAERGLVWMTVQSSQYFGPGASGQSIFGDWFIDPVLQKKAVRFVGNPDLRHAWAYAPDFGRAMALLATTPQAQLLNRPWIIPHVSHQSARDMTRSFFPELVRQGIVSSKSPIKTVAIPRFVLRMLGLFNPIIQARDEMLYQFVKDFEASGAQFVTATGFEATPLEQAIAQTVSYWKVTKST